MTTYARYEAHGDVHYGVVEGDAVRAITAAPYEDHEVYRPRSRPGRRETALARHARQDRSHRAELPIPPRRPHAPKRPGAVLQDRLVRSRTGRRRGNPHGSAGAGRFHTARGRARPRHRQEGAARQQGRRARLHSRLHLRQRRKRPETGRPATFRGGAPSRQTPSRPSAPSS